MLNKIYDPIFNTLLLKPNCNNSNTLFKTISYVFLFIMIFGFLMNSYNRFRILLYKKLKPSISVFIIFKMLFDLFMVLFMYNACITCNYMLGFIYMVIFLFIIDIIFYLIFKNELKQHSSKL